jgi:anti-anti-sigma factor
MRFTVEKRDDSVIFTLLNENLDSRISAKMKAEVLILAQPDIGALIIDLSHVEFIDSSGLGVLLLAQRQLKEYDAPVILVGLQPSVRVLLEISHLHEIFNIYDTMEEVIADLEQEAD